MAIGGLVAVPELQAEGPARLISQTAGYFEIVFLQTGASMTVEQRNVVRYAILPGTRVRFEHDGEQHEGETATVAPRTDKASGLLTYQIHAADGPDVEVAENGILLVHQPRDAAEQLRTASFHELMPRFARAGTPKPPEAWGPLTYSARESVLDWRDGAWRDTGGVIGLAGGRIDPLPHQILAARRMLADRQIRFLLADEVGLGKTIEAGLVIQSLLAMNPKLRVLVIVPGALASQWFLEMFVKFGGRSFTMLDSERLADTTGNPWANQFVILSSRAVEELSGKDSLRFATSKWDIVVVDECHRMQVGGMLYRRVATLSKKSQHVLLLSATPPRQHADAYLALLHLLQPAAYDLEALDAFEAKLTATAEVGELLRRSREDGDREAVAQAWVDLLPDDPELPRLLPGFLAGDAEGREALLAYIREYYQLDHRIIRNRRQVLARLSAESGVSGLALGSRSLKWVDYKVDAAEGAVRAALADYRAALIDGDASDPRLAHWLLQLELAVAAHPRVLDRLLAMRAAVLEEPDEFRDYAERVPEGETLAAVLRSDLSEAETTSQIAVSCASSILPGVEDAALTALRRAVAAWVKRIPARTRRLVEKLKSFWEEFPQEKVLIFTGHAIAVQEVADYLRGRIEPGAIETFGAHQDPLEREAAASRFRDDDNCYVLVSDALGGEGRNFQFVSLVVHHDLPWSIAQVEQRVGRVDRLGRDGEVPSWVVVPGEDAGLDGAWARLLDESIGVFTASSSGLEFVASRVEEQALLAGLAGGVDGLLAALPGLVEQVAAEREARDAAEDELFQESSAAYAEAAALAQSVARAPVPVSALCRWLRGMGGYVRRDEDEPRPFALRTRSADEPVEGLFDRRLAMRHEGLAYFARGHDLIDRLLDDAQQANWCRAMAWRRKPGPTCKAWEGLRVTYELALDVVPLMEAGLPLESCRRIFAVVPPIRIRRHVRMDGSVEEDRAIIAHLRPGFDAQQDQCLSPKTSRETWMRPLVQGQVEKITSWQDRVRTAATAAQSMAAGLLEQERTVALGVLEPALKAQADLATAHASAATRRLGPAHPDAERLMEEAVAEQAEVSCLLAAMRGAKIEVASMAYVVVA